MSILLKGDNALSPIIFWWQVYLLSICRYDKSFQCMFILDHHLQPTLNLISDIPFNITLPFFCYKSLAHSSSTIFRCVDQWYGNKVGLFSRCLFSITFFLLLFLKKDGVIVRILYPPNYLFLLFAFFLSSYFLFFIWEYILIYTSTFIAELKHSFMLNVESTECLVM